VVVQVGPEVDLRVGDRVMGIAAGCFGAYTTTYAELVTRIPGDMPFEEAATIPIAFLTAHYTLNRLGRMAAGDRVLIHAASGGVGLAAIQLARLAGAEVFATAGSPAKRGFLKGLGLTHVMNSRTLAFSEETLAATGRRGVDLVLNSLSGDYIPKSLAALASTGRFLEIGKVGIWSPEQVHKVRPRAAYHTVALDEMARKQPSLIGEMLAELIPFFQDGRLKPLPVTVYPVDRVSDAFRLMAQTRHFGKVIITQDAVAPANDSGGSAMAGYGSAAGTCLITGGLNTLGLLVAQRLVDLGARHILLASDTEPSETAESDPLDALRPRRPPR
jgi:NADPH:quinone reductase-like Zn-dependent oxidoreductase